MKLSRVLVLILLFAGLSLVPVAYAAPDAPAAKTLSVVADDIAVYNDSALNVETPLNSGGSSATGADCISQYITYLKFDLSSIPAGSTLSTAKLVLRSTGSATGSVSMNMKLWGSNTDSWTEGAGQITWAGKPTFDSDLSSTATGPVASGSDVNFLTSSQFVSFLQTQVNGDRTATLAIETIACNAPIARQYMASKETGGGNPPAQLIIEGTTPTAVSLSTASAQQQTSWPLYAGLAAVALLVVAGVTISRRRTA